MIRADAPNAFKRQVNSLQFSQVVIFIFSALKVVATEAVVAVIVVAVKVVVVVVACKYRLFGQLITPSSLPESSNLISSVIPELRLFDNLSL